MKKNFLFVLIGLVLTGCGKGDSRLLTSATGTIYECLVVMPNRPLGADQLALISRRTEQDARTKGSGYVEPVATTYDLVKSTMSAAMPGLPQVEPYFDVTQVAMGQFDNYLKPTRNILIIDINRDKYTQLKVTRSRDVWSKPQAVFRIQAPGDEEVVAYWLDHGEQVREWFVREEIARQIRFYRANTNKEARARLNSRGYDLWIPEDYIIIKNEKLKMKNSGDSVEVLWCCNSKGPMRKDLIVYSYPYTTEEQFTNPSICAMRDEVLGQLVSAQVEGSHMGTEYRYFPPESRQVTALATPQAQQDSLPPAFYAVETRGLWKILNGEAMGGPFVCLTRLDPVNGRVVTAETFLFASGQKKRNALRQSEAVLYTLEMPDSFLQRRKP